MVFKFSDNERTYLAEMRAISTDENGSEILVGLTVEETAWYMQHSRRFLTEDRDHEPENKKKYLQLHEKHERARFVVLGAEHQLRTNNPSKH